MKVIEQILSNVILPNNSLQINEAILKDKKVQQLVDYNVKRYLCSIPTVILKDGKSEIIWLDETNDPHLKKVNELIEQRIEQIKNAFNTSYPQP